MPGERLRVWQREGELLAPAQANGRGQIWSALLSSWWEADGERLWLMSVDGTRWPTHAEAERAAKERALADELAARAQIEIERAAKEIERARAERERTRAERARADDLAARLAEVEAQLAALRSTAQE